MPGIFGDLGIWRFDDLMIWRFGDLEILENLNNKPFISVLVSYETKPLTKARR